MTSNNLRDPRNVIDTKKWKLHARDILTLSEVERYELANDIIKHIKQENLCLAEWDPTAIADDGEAGLWLMRNGGKCGGLVEFIMGGLNDEHFAKFMIEFNDGISFEDVHLFESSNGNKCGWSRTYVSLQKYGECLVGGEIVKVKSRYLDVLSRSLKQR